MRVLFHTLGCKVNTCESEEISENLKKHGYETVTAGTADCIVINSCTVTGESGRKTRQTLRRARRENPDAVIVLTGCLTQAFPDAAEQLPEADIVIGNRSNPRIPALIDEFRQTGARIVLTAAHEKDEKFTGVAVSGTVNHTRAFLKIQDGCNRFCSYCIIPYAKGRSRSRSLEEIRTCVAGFAANGYKEAVLVGIDLTDYGRDLPGGLTLADAVFAAAATAGIERVRLGSLEPHNLTDHEIERLAQCEKLCPQFHISLQSGSNSVLKRMNRRYTAEEYAHIVARLRERFPACAITTDIICGFPGETEAEFAETLAFAEMIRFEKVHIFPYSLREGTRAAKMDGHLAKAKKDARCARLAKVCEQIRAEILQAEIGNIYDVLFESIADGYIHGYTPNYFPVRMPADDALRGSIKKVRLVGVDGDSCMGQLCE
ncbi:MAG: tRNA (N(6)-L-threonylcarbamoyladenosine(37)-C(2))-methylthiotransferase MtaB [Clostridia bacterium]|nr:tRNA (N(6)-L-threonylcarbamoyladenosine(37)-C(2))-methylthiotransferase MtaB [Clostridia bacterium]